MYQHSGHITAQRILDAMPNQPTQPLPHQVGPGTTPYIKLTNNWTCWTKQPVLTISYSTRTERLWVFKYLIYQYARLISVPRGYNVLTIDIQIFVLWWARAHFHIIMVGIILKSFENRCHVLVGNKQCSCLWIKKYKRA